jgi:hypothetical protein
MAIKISKEEFEKKFGQGMPVAQPQAPQPSGGVNLGISDAFHGGIDQIKQGASQITSGQGNPIVSGVEGALKVGAGAVGAAFSPLAPLFKPVEMGINAVANQVGNIPAVQKFAMSPAGQTTSRVAEDLTNAGAVAGGLLGTEGALKGAGKVAKATGEAVKPAVAGTGRILKSAGEGSYGITVNPSEGTMRAMQSYKENAGTLMDRIKNNVSGETKGKPITEANTAARKGLMGTEQEIGVQAGRHMQDIWKNKIEPTLNATKGKLDMKKFFDVVQNEIKTTVPELSRRNDLMEGLDALRSQYGKVGKVGLRKLQDYKSGWAQTLPESSFKGKPIAGALKEVKKIASDKAREFIHDNIPEGSKQDYIDYGNLKSIREAGIKSGVGDLAKKSISKGAWQFIMDKAVTPAATVLGRILYKTGEGLEFIGDDGAKTVGDIVGNEMPNKQGGFVNFNAIAKSMDNFDKDKILAFVDSVNQGKTPSKEVMAQAQKVAEAMGLDSKFGSNAAMAKEFTKILDMERENTKKSLKAP